MLILLIDNNTRRAKKILKIFTTVLEPENVFWLEGDCCYCADDIHDEIDPPMQIPLVMLHENDKSILEGFNELKYDKLIKYTGSFNVPKKTYWFNRTLSAEEDSSTLFITNNEADEILRWAQNECEVPNCIIPPNETNLLFSLSFLCQGFLLTFLNPQTKEPDLECSSIVIKNYKDCLIAMGVLGHSDADNLMRITDTCNLIDEKNRKDLQRTVTQISWWKEIFEAEGALDKIYTEWKIYMEDNLQTWPVVKSLIEHILAKNNPSLEKVTEAYVAIHNTFANHNK